MKSKQFGFWNIERQLLLIKIFAEIEAKKATTSKKGIFNKTHSKIAARIFNKTHTEKPKHHSEVLAVYHSVKRFKHYEPEVYYENGIAITRFKTGVAFGVIPQGFLQTDKQTLELVQR